MHSVWTFLLVGQTISHHPKVATTRGAPLVLIGGSAAISLGNKRWGLEMGSKRGAVAGGRATACKWSGWNHKCRVPQQRGKRAQRKRWIRTLPRG